MTRPLADENVTPWPTHANHLEPYTSLLGGSWLVISRVISRITIVITHSKFKGLITPLITTHEPPSEES